MIIIMTLIIRFRKLCIVSGQRKGIQFMTDITPIGIGWDTILGNPQNEVLSANVNVLCFDTVFSRIRFRDEL